jgi:hypothetical protein
VFVEIERSAGIGNFCVEGKESFVAGRRDRGRGLQ